MHGDQVRFGRKQVGLLDALIASEENVAVDAGFERVRQELYSFAGLKPADPSADFVGHLRDYQRDGLGWLGFLQRFGLGGCLADDMGLGKTVQVLALLESRRDLFSHGKRQAPRPSLVVVPRSLVFHWKREAARFTPKLRFLDHTGSLREKPGAHFSDYDVVITTYGTLRRDALEFKAQRFDYCVLDEAQAIKNAGTLSAKAARLLCADHRLAMSGTPVENHLGELWSLFEFLNPGLFGSATVFGRAGRNPEPATRTLLARALRPFVLRRTKSQVARELPEKTEQTIFCDLEGREKKQYDELRAYYRARLLKDFEHGDRSRVKFQALEALLRLRQAACHPGLIDKSKVGEPSAKVDTLMAQLEQVRDEGHKALVFSQFTSLLAIVRDRLDRDKVAYAYLDGRTREREARVEEFQNDPNIKLFLISLKAGGLGLNLHAAEYVYLLDPWWNPAVEAQAIDRAHRIGQTRQVFAYRLIARNTVEEKVLELQKSKRDLADAIITADNSLLHNLTREDLELLLS
jgi:SNF2 family DNA or RNA helicase